MPTNTANLLKYGSRGSKVFLAALGIFVALYLLWRRRRNTVKKSVVAPIATSLKAVEPSNEQAKLEMLSKNTESIENDLRIPVNLPQSECSIQCPTNGKSKRQEKKEKRKEVQKKRDVEQPKVRTIMDKHKTFADALVAYADYTQDEVTASLLERLYPKRFESHGHVVVVQLPVVCSSDDTKSTEAKESLTLEEFRRVAKAFGKSLQIPTDAVIVDTQGIEGELRKPIHEVVWFEEGENGALSSAVKCLAPIVAAAPKGKYDSHVLTTSFTTHVENKTRYSFDVLKVMFSSGNTEIRMHFGTIDATNEVVVDMFAGIGYFTLPLAIHGGPAMIHALEKNPDSAYFLQMNAYQNGVADRVTVYCGDNREVAGSDLDGKCDRVLMGYIPCCKAFVPKAIAFLKREEVVREVEEEIEVDVVSPASPEKNEATTKSNHRGKNKRNSKSAKTEDAQEVKVTEKIIKLVKSLKTISRPVGVVHYHYLAGKDDAEAVAMRDIASGLAKDVCSSTDDSFVRPLIDYKVTRVYQVKSYSPKVWHYVADVMFGREK